MIAIVDYGVGNLGSIQNMIKKIGAESRLVAQPDELLSATKIILPGVGAFDAGMTNLANSGFIPALNDAVLVNKIPVLGICLGMQLMTQGSEEGSLPGLGWIQAQTIKFRPAPGEELRIPHIGWNIVTTSKAGELVDCLPDDSRFYFVHSYHVRCDRREDVLMQAKYGSHTFDAAFSNGHIFGCQFHPEKSHKFGLTLLRNFVERA